MTQKIHNTASVKRTVSKATESLITAKCQINDLFDIILNAMELVYGEGESDKCCSEIYDRLRSINEYVETAIIDSIHCKTLTLNSTEFLNLNDRGKEFGMWYNFTIFVEV